MITTKTEKRVTEIIHLILSGLSSSQIFNIVTGNNYNWKLGERAFYKIYKQAKEYFKNAACFERDKEIGLSISRLNDLYYKSYTKNETKNCLMIQRELNSLLGLYFEDSIINEINKIKNKLNLD